MYLSSTEQQQRACTKTLRFILFRRPIQNVAFTRMNCVTFIIVTNFYANRTIQTLIQNILPSDHVASENVEPTTSESTKKRGRPKSSAAKTATSTVVNSSNVDSSIDTPEISSQTSNNTQSSTSLTIPKSRTVIATFILHLFRLQISLTFLLIDS